MALIKARCDLLGHYRAACLKIAPELSQVSATELAGWMVDQVEATTKIYEHVISCLREKERIDANNN